MDESLPVVSITLWRSDAVVLFDWLHQVDFEQEAVNEPAVKQALTDLLTRFECDTDVVDVTQEDIDVAKAEVTRNMGW